MGILLDRTKQNHSNSSSSKWPHFATQILIRSERIREQVGQESLRSVLEERQHKWFGHVYRMERERKPKQFMEAEVEGRKQRGRRRLTFESRIEEIGSRRGKTLA
jgi:hypothetical protein